MKPTDYVALMDEQILSIEVSPQQEARFRAAFPDHKVRVIKGAQPEFWAIVTHGNPFIPLLDDEDPRLQKESS